MAVTICPTLNAPAYSEQFRLKFAYFIGINSISNFMNLTES